MEEHSVEAAAEEAARCAADATLGSLRPTARIDAGRAGTCGCWVEVPNAYAGDMLR